ncbi:MAG: nuclear transport factor 2 family protein [Pseudomonadota bacterium]
MSAQTFVKDYEAALGTQDWAAVAPLIDDDARVIFSDGTLHAGKDAIRSAYERNFRRIEGEQYRIADIHWLHQAATSAAYMFEFHWTGTVNGTPVSGTGRGTTILRHHNGQWRLVGEHLGPRV